MFHTSTFVETFQTSLPHFFRYFRADPNLIPFQGGPDSMIGQRSISQKVQARMQQLVGLRRTTEVCANTTTIRSIGGASSCASYDASSTCSSHGGLQGDLKLMEMCKDVAVVTDASVRSNGGFVRTWCSCVHVHVHV